MRIGLVVDAACDLPPEYVAAHHITVLPSRVVATEEVFVDGRDHHETQRFLARWPDLARAQAHAEPYSSTDIEALFLERLVLDYDCVFCLTLTAARSAIHDNALRAASQVLGQCQQARLAAGQRGQFLVQVLDTQSALAGSAVVAAEAARLIQSGQTASRIREHLDRISLNTYGFLVPRDLRHLRARLHARGDRSIGRLRAALAAALDITPILAGWRGGTEVVAREHGFDAAANALLAHAGARVQAGLMACAVCLSYGGNLQDIHRLPGYTKLADACRNAEVTLLEGPMSITGMVTVGAGALSLGLASADYHPGW